MAAHNDLGRRGERLAEQHLTALGHAVIDRNWRCEHGEIDLVTRHGRDLVIVEVKTRSGLGFGHPIEAITPAKLARLRRLASAWRAAHPEVRAHIRIDAVAILAPPGERPVVEHVEGLF